MLKHMEPEHIILKGNPSFTQTLFKKGRKARIQIYISSIQSYLVSMFYFFLITKSQLL